MSYSWGLSRGSRGEASYTYTLDIRPICVCGEGCALLPSAHFGKDAGGVVREEADTHLASHTNWIHPGRQGGDGHLSQIALVFEMHGILLHFSLELEPYRGSPLLPLYQGSYYVCFLRAGSGLTFTFLICLELVFRQGGKLGSDFTVLQVDVPFSQHRLLKMLSFLQLTFLPFLSNIKWVKLHRLMLGSLILSCWSTCLFLCQDHAVATSVILQ